MDDNSVNFQIGSAAYSLTTTMLKVLMDKYLIWKTTDTSLTPCMKLGGSNNLSSDLSFTTDSYKFSGATPTEIGMFEWCRISHTDPAGYLYEIGW